MLQMHRGVFLLLLKIEIHTIIVYVIKWQKNSKCTFFLRKWNYNRSWVFLLLLKIEFLQYSFLPVRSCKWNSNHEGFSSSFETRDGCAWLCSISAKFVIFNICYTEVEDNIYSKYILSRREIEGEKEKTPLVALPKHS